MRLVANTVASTFVAFILVTKLTFVVYDCFRRMPWKLQQVLLEWLGCRVYCPRLHQWLRSRQQWQLRWFVIGRVQALTSDGYLSMGIRVCYCVVCSMLCTVCVACWSTVVGLSTYTCSWCTTPSKCSAGSCPIGYGLASDGSCSGECISHEILASSRHTFSTEVCAIIVSLFVACSVWR